MLIVFLCTANSARSQMAEGFAKAIASSEIEIWSAGTRPASSVHPMAVLAMKELGIDISSADPKHLAEVPNSINLIVAVCGSAAKECPSVPGAKTEAWNLPDPAAASGTEAEVLSAFRDIRDEIKGRVDDLLSRLS